jgi:sugar O-acyltransferase (sialic acid O-acetyltransferase NeuD family)
MRRIVLYGIGSPIVVDYEESARRAAVTIALGVRNIAGESQLTDNTPTCLPETTPADLRDLPILVPLFTPGYRQMAVREAECNGFAASTTLIDPTAVLPHALELGEGTYINAACVFGAGSVIGPFALVNRGANVGHHARCGRFVSIGPGAVIAGCVTLGDGVVIGAGAVILPGVTVSPNAVVGAGAVVTHDVGPECLVLGNPACIARRDIGGYNGVKVT